MDGNGRTVSYVYDADGQLVNVNYPTGSGAGTGISYTIDAANRKTGMTDVTGSWGYTFDAANRLTQISAPNGTTGYGYDNANRRVSMTVSGVTGSWTYGYDAGNRLLTTSNPYGETATNVFDAANRLTSTTMGNSSVVTNGYDAANRTTSIVHSTSGNATLASYQYSYDNVSNVSTRTDSDGTVTSFGYDASDQLTSEVRDNSHGTGYSIALAYDHNGNRTSKVQNGVTTSLSYDHHDKLLSAGSKSYGYDSNGNCTSVSVGTSVTTLTYDIENRVVGISYPGGASNSFAYNGDDLRTKKVDSTGTQNYVTDGSSPASAVLKDGNAVYTPGLSEHRGSASKFYHGDALGSTRGITDSSQAVTDSVLYDAFGNTVTRTGTTPTPFGFVGKAQYQSDSDSGLQLLGHRYYDPSIGRFLSRDPAKHGTNWYAYCGNNPLNRTDTLGLFWRQIGAILGGVIGAIIGAPEGGVGALPGAVLGTSIGSFLGGAMDGGTLEEVRNGMVADTLTVGLAGLAHAAVDQIPEGGGNSTGGSGQPLYHYGPDPIPPKQGLNPGTWVTNDPNMSQSEASAITGVYAPPNYVHETIGDPTDPGSIMGWEEIAPGQFQGQLRNGGPIISVKPITQY